MHILEVEMILMFLINFNLFKRSEKLQLRNTCKSVNYQTSKQGQNNTG